MKFEPLKVEQKQEKKTYTPVPEGEYKFNVISAKETVSKAGNDMIKLHIEIFNDTDKGTVFDYLLSNKSKRIRNFAESVGLLDKYQHGELTEIDCMHKSGKCYVFIEQSAQYGDSNRVKYYMRPDKVTITEIKHDGFGDEELPF